MNDYTPPSPTPNLQHLNPTHPTHQPANPTEEPSPPAKAPTNPAPHHLIKADIEDVYRQVQDEELDEGTAQQLINKYRLEQETPKSAPPPAPRSRTRATVGTLLLIVMFIAVSITAWVAIRSGNQEQISETTPVDLSQITNDQMEAVIAANPDLPEIAGMRLALADRYFENGAFSSALPHYLGALEGQLDASRTARALARVGWMSHLSNASSLAETYLHRALAADPTYQEANLFLGLVLLDLGLPEASLEQLDPLLNGKTLPNDLRPLVEDAAARARNLLSETA